MMGRMQAAEQLRRVLQMFAASLTEEQALEVTAVFDRWMAGKAYVAGSYLTYGENTVGDPQIYRILQNHTSQTDWTPDNTPSLYDAIGLDESGYPVWSQPAGAYDAYNTGDIVSYRGALYQCLVDGNVYDPDNYPNGWAAC